MADALTRRLKALNASMKVALGKLTGSDELEAQGVRERAGRVADAAKKVAKKTPARAGAKAATKRGSKASKRSRK